MMSAAQAFESFSQEEEEAAREAYPAPQGEAAPPLRAAAAAPPLQAVAVAEPESLGQKQDQRFSPVQSHGSMFDPSAPFPAQSARPPDVFSPSQQRSDTLGEGADGSPQTPPPAAHQALPPSNNNLGVAQDPPMLIQFSPRNDEAPARHGDVRPPLGPPDLVDHGPSHPPLPIHPAPQGPPDLTQAQAQPPSSHDDHYNWYSDQQAGGMPDVTGVQGRQGKAPDILGAGGVVHSVPTSDRNLYMETGQLEEGDEPVIGARGGEAELDSLPPMVGGNDPPPLMPPTFGPSSASMPPMVGGNDPPPSGLAASSLSPPTPPSQDPTLPPMVGGNELPPIVRMVVGSSSDTAPPPSQPREPVEGEAGDHQVLAPPTSYPPGAAAAPAGLYSGGSGPPSSIFSPPPPPTSAPAQVEERSEAAGSEHRTAEMMAPTPVRPAPLPTPGRDIAGEESGGGGGVAPPRRGSREAWESEEEMDSEEEERRHQQ